MSEQAVEPMMVTPSAVMRDDLSPVDGGFWIYDEMCAVDKKTGFPVPHYSVQVAAQVFFARSPDWLRWREKPKLPDHPEGFFILDGKKIEMKRTKKGARIYTLADIERMAHALAQNEALDGLKLTKIIMTIKWQARLHGVIE